MLFITFIGTGVILYGIARIVEHKYGAKFPRKSENQEFNETVSTMNARHQNGSFM